MEVDLLRTLDRKNAGYRTLYDLSLICEEFKRLLEPKIKSEPLDDCMFKG